MSNPPKVRKIAVLGSRAVGKSSLVIQFVESHFSETYYPTIENTFTKLVRHRNQDYAAEIIDTAGQDEFSILNSRHALGIHGYVLVYSIASRSSFDMTSIIRDKILNLAGVEWIPIVLVGNKADLAGGGQRHVGEEEGRKLASEWGASFLETSAKEGTNVAKIFELTLMQIEKASGEGEEKKSEGGCMIL
ncbi:GTP-binding protein [Irineochytrium annulatum]|nr:GTP-binding protein [Irineochytrium annulatum]